MLAGKARELDSEAERLGSRLTELTATETQHAQAIHEQEAEQDRLTQRDLRSGWRAPAESNVLNHTALEVDRSENRIAFNQTRSAELAGRNEQIVAERAAVSAQIDGMEGAESRAAAGRGNGTDGIGDAACTSGRTGDARGHACFADQRFGSAQGDVCGGSRREAGESLLQLHGEQKQAEEALVHQSEFVEAE